MSYSIHIIKSEYSWEAKDNPITLEEWTKLVEIDPEMKMKCEFEGVNPRISVSDSDDCVIEKMKEIATKLSCRVVGDEGEEY